MINVMTIRGVGIRLLLCNAYYIQQRALQVGREQDGVWLIELQCTLSEQLITLLHDRKLRSFLNFRGNPFLAIEPHAV